MLVLNTITFRNRENIAFGNPEIAFGNREKYVFYFYN